MTSIKDQSGYGSIYAWDVVNEAIVYNANGGGWMQHAADDGTGHEHSWFSRMNDYIDKAFTYAHEADPDSKLFYNEFMMERFSGKHNAVVDLVQGMKNRGIPIHGVGMQMHVRLDWGLTRSSVAQIIKDYGDTGVEVHITELDIELCSRTNGTSTICDPNDQADLAA